VSTTLSEPLRGRALFDRVWKFALRRVLFPVCALIPFAYFFPKIALFYAACGAYDLSRNTGLKLSTLRRYFIGNGFLVWMLSPINILLDLLSLPYINKGVYRLEDLPLDYQNEVRHLIQVTNDADLIRQVEERSKEHKRAMFFWRSTGRPAASSIARIAPAGPVPFTVISIRNGMCPPRRLAIDVLVVMQTAPAPLDLDEDPDPYFPTNLTAGAWGTHPRSWF